VLTPRSRVDTHIDWAVDTYLGIDVERYFRADFRPFLDNTIFQTHFHYKMKHKGGKFEK